MKIIAVKNISNPHLICSNFNQNQEYTILVANKIIIDHDCLVILAFF